MMRAILTNKAISNFTKICNVSRKSVILFSVIESRDGQMDRITRKALSKP